MLWCVRYHAQSLRLEAFEYFYVGPWKSPSSASHDIRYTHLLAGTKYVSFVNWQEHLVTRSSWSIISIESVITTNGSKRSDFIREETKSTLIQKMITTIQFGTFGLLCLLYVNRKLNYNLLMFLWGWATNCQTDHHNVNYILKTTDPLSVD
jgi:hypothetical protein